ncbi:asparagine synthetase B family protein [Paucibacter sp. DJ2R-2]|uniref:asparagine synthase-related protein n=1 Tax=Paucibacter sp. DJ2R-2 TaxID=2893558 RepID=UPI0021E431F5|nr:asparagine synthetase B family protein [Paucibacter sp. DJ2R-2]MCV2438701.1 hypothetical protein [Paucibacter sp. DJ2R-2]
MFRYLAFVWDSNLADPSAAANELGSQTRQIQVWRQVLSRPGMQVYTRGEKTGINDSLLLHDHRGVILGKLFQRQSLEQAFHPRAKQGNFDQKSSTEILNSGGRALQQQFWGRYIAFFTDKGGAHCVLRDPSGTLPCFHLQRHGVTVVFSWLEDALQVLDAQELPRVNWDALRAQLLHGPQIGKGTALDGVQQVLPGEMLDLSQGRPTLLWDAVHFARSPLYLPFEDAASLLRHTVRSCVQAWAGSYDTLLLRLSGGVDSSIMLSCLAAGSSPADVICLNYHSPGSNSDERHYARLAASRAGRDLLEREREPGFQLERVLQTARMPDPVHYLGWMNSRTDAHLAAAHAAPALFTGAGGDALFFEISSWWPAADYLATRGLDSGFASAALDAARLGRTSVWRAARFALRERLKPDPALRATSGPATAFSTESSAQGVDMELFSHPAQDEAQRLPIGKFTQATALMQPIGYYDPFEQEAAPELVNPLLSQPLVELCLRLPSHLLTRGGQGRALARRAFENDLPASIIRRRSKGGMEEHVKAVLNANINTVRELLLDGELCRRGLLDRSRLQAQLFDRPSTQSASSSQIHALVAVEAWLSRWQP